MSSCFLSTSCFPRTSVEHAIELASAISGYHVELSAPHDFQSVESLGALLKRKRAEGFEFLLHNYFPSPEHSIILDLATSNESLRERVRELVSNALAIAVEIDSPIYGVHAGYLRSAVSGPDGMFIFDNGAESYLKSFDNAVRFVNDVAPVFEKAGVRLLLENLFPAKNKNHSLFCTPNEIRQYLEAVPSSVGMLLDLGHLNVAANILGFDKLGAIEGLLNDFGSRIFEIHISENDGERDQHLAPLGDSWQFDALSIINEFRRDTDSPIFYCLEARSSTLEDLKKSYELIEKVIG